MTIKSIAITVAGVAAFGGRLLSGCTGKRNRKMV